MIRQYTWIKKNHEITSLSGRHISAEWMVENIKLKAKAELKREVWRLEHNQTKGK